MITGFHGSQARTALTATCVHAAVQHHAILHPRHCEEPVRRSNPECCRGRSLDCFAALAMTAAVSRSQYRSSPGPTSGNTCRPRQAAGRALLRGR
ncbi:hypothetical protein XH86_09525 [Bradyrhizobium guangdongense]|uniref:Uncharacterized protein n=1 Tax=Bradyrhizobium guangdongense TaxID=1325090 RepID=A0ABX6UCB9_9BRAD|nr:hypothetical protein X265_09530 [Bradyrhizobium guangdongense]QOZ58951.1 hypothetical protein XH86_09525 [Bradyrhizobium guangdongense]